VSADLSAPVFVVRPEIGFGCSPSRKQRRTLSKSPRLGTTPIRIDAFFRLAPLQDETGQGF